MLYANTQTHILCDALHDRKSNKKGKTTSVEKKNFIWFKLGFIESNEFNGKIANRKKEIERLCQKD